MPLHFDSLLREQLQDMLGRYYIKRYYHDQLLAKRLRYITYAVVFVYILVISMIMIRVSGLSFWQYVLLLCSIPTIGICGELWARTVQNRFLTILPIVTREAAQIEKHFPDFPDEELIILCRLLDSYYREQREAAREALLEARSATKHLRHWPCLRKFEYVLHA